MKRPYREGDWFAIPHGGGAYSPGIVVRGTRKLVRACVFRARYDGLPTLAQVSELVPSDAAWSGLMSDRAIVHERWPMIGGRSAFDASNWPREFAEKYIAVPIALETFVRTGVMPRLARTVRDLGIEPSDAMLDAFVGETALEWRRPLSADSLAVVERWLARRADASLRFYGESLAQLPAAAEFAGLRHVHIGVGVIPPLPVFERVHELSLERSLPLDAAVRSFPNVRALRIAAANDVVDVRELSGLQHLAALDLSGVVVEGLDSISSFPKLAALRLNRTRGWSTLDAVSRASLTTFALEHQPQLVSLDPLGAMSLLEQLELRGLWQFNVDEMQWVAALPNLQRVTIDIGGRRRNVELYRRHDWAAALPFEQVLIRAADELAAPR